MEIIVKPIDKNIDKYIKKGIKNFLLPLVDYSVSYTSYFTLDDIKILSKEYVDVDFFIGIDKNIMNNDLEFLKNILTDIEKLNIKGVFFYDFSVLKLVKDLNLKLDLVWNGTHMTTNYRTCDYYNKLGVKYALLSKEITKEEIIEIKNKSNIISIVELISKPVVAFSKRKLISNYCKNINKKTKNKLIIHEKVSNQNYYLTENSLGTLFLKDTLLNGSSVLEELLINDFKYILLKEDNIDEDIFIAAVSNIIYFINNYKLMSSGDKKKWLDNQNELLGEDTGFFFKKTIYKVK